MRLGQDVLTDFQATRSSEWVLGNGLGGSASGTATGAHLKPTHAQLVVIAAGGRPRALLLGIEERLTTEGTTFDLSTRLQPAGKPRPAGYRLLVEFRLDPWPIWRFRANDTVIEKSLFMLYGHHAIAVSYRHVSGPEASITASPLVLARPPNELQREAPEMLGAMQAAAGRVRIETLPQHPALVLWHNGAFLPARARERITYLDDAGAHGEDAFVPGYVEARVSPTEALHLIASAEEDLFRALAREDRLGTPPPRTLAGCVEALESSERERTSSWRRRAYAAAETTAGQASAARAAPSEAGAAATTTLDSAPILAPDDAWLGSLASQLQLGLTRRGRRLTFLGALPRVSERGEDVLRATVGLVSLRGFETVREILRGHIDYLDEGLAPAAFDEDGRPQYGAAEPALWLVIVGELYARRSGDAEFEKQHLYPAFEAITHAFRSGTRHGVRLDTDGLLAAGEGSAGAKGAALNALWYHASVGMAHVSRRSGHRESAAFHMAWANEHLRRFNELFWDESRGRLFASRHSSGPGIATTPDQLLAVSLPPSLLTPERALRLVTTIEEELFTPYGLREEPGAGLVRTTWLAHFHSAYLRAHGRNDAAQARVREWLEVLDRGLERCGLASLPEAFEVGTSPEDVRLADSAHPTSIVAAGEMVRLWVEDLDHAASRVLQE